MLSTQSSSIFLKSKEEAMPHVLAWLGRTYEERPGSMLLKKDVHASYAAFCAEHRFETTTNAAFGKMFKRVFPAAEVRRLVKHNETTFFYENMAEQATGKAPSPTSTSTSPTTSTSRQALSDLHAPATRLPDSPLGSPEDQEPQSIQPLQYRVKKMTLTSSSQSPRSTSTTATARDRRPRLEGRTRSPKRQTSTKAEKGQPTGRDASKHASKRPKEGQDDEEQERETEGSGGGSSVESEMTRKGREPSEEETARPGQTNLSSWTTDAQLGFTDTLHQFCQLYRHEMWGFCPINPSMVEYPTLSYIFNTDDGASERSVLSVSAHYIVSAGYLLLGDVTHGREFFWKAREHLSYVFDSSNYDAACLLKHLSWMAILFSTNGPEGYDRETYYLSLCKNICQALGAENDGLFLNTLKTMAIRERTTSYEGEIQKAMRSPHFQNGWKDVGPLSPHLQFNEILNNQLLESYKNIVLLIEVARQGHFQPLSSVVQGFVKELREIQRYEDGYKHIYGESPPPRSCAINISCVLVCRTIIYNHLNDYEAVMQHLRGLVQHFSRIDAASLAIVLTEFASRGLFWREVVCVMLQHRLYDQLDHLTQIVHPLRQHFYWVDAEMSYVEKAMSEAHSVRESYPPFASHPSPALPSLHYASQSPQQPFNSLPPLPPPRSPSPLFPYQTLALPPQLPDFREALGIPNLDDHAPLSFLSSHSPSKEEKHKTHSKKEE